MAASQRNKRTPVNVPTLMVSAGVAALVSALVLAIGMVILLMMARHSDNNAAAQPTTVNLGAQRTPAGAAPAGTAPVAGAPAAGAPAAPAGETPAGETPAPAAPVAPVAGTPAAPAPTAAAPAAGSTPTAPTLAGLKSDLNLLASGASASQKAVVLEDGARAVPPITNMLQLAKQFQPAGFRYELVGPVTQNGTTAGARLKLSSPGYESQYATMTYVWKDGRWKLTSKSICDIAAHASQPCNI
ncbi:MAG: hypothetical protein QM658_04210 [Gordonia sp. (in: high G+C Gram-positive bacteria)]